MHFPESGDECRKPKVNSTQPKKMSVTFCLLFVRLSGTIIRVIQQIKYKSVFAFSRKWRWKLKTEGQRYATEKNVFVTFRLSFVRLSETIIRVIKKCNKNLYLHSPETAMKVENRRSTVHKKKLCRKKVFVTFCLSGVRLLKTIIKVIQKMKYKSVFTFSRKWQWN